MEQDIYIEYANNHSEHISFTKAKKLILKKLPKILKYNCADKEKSVNFFKYFNNKVQNYRQCLNTKIITHHYVKKLIKETLKGTLSQF